MSEIWEFVRAFREWADLIGLTLLGSLIVAGLIYGAVLLTERILRR